MGLGAPFWRFWCAAALTNLGDGIRLAAFPLLAAAITSNPAAVALVAAAAAVPWLVTGLVAGSLADRRSARVLICVSDATRLVVLAALIAVLASGTPSIGVVATAALLIGVAETVRDTAAGTVVPRLVSPRALERANGRLAAAEITANEFVGPLVGATLFASGAALPFVANSAALAFAVLFVLSVPSVLLTHRPPVGGPTSSGVRAGVAWLAQHRVLRALVFTGAAVALADSAWFAVFVLWTREELDLGPTGFGLLLATGAAGGLAGALLADRAVGGTRHRAVIGTTMAVTALAPALLFVVPTVPVTVAVIVLTSSAFGVLNVSATSLRHRLVPPELLGRTIGAWRVLTQGGAAVGAVLGGAVAAVAGLDAPFLLCAVVGGIAALGWALASARPGSGGLTTA